MMVPVIIQLMIVEFVMVIILHMSCTESWADNYEADNTIDDGSCYTVENYSLNQNANLISFLSLPDDASIGNVLPISENPNITGIVGEGVAASPNPVLGWVGSLSELDLTRGYWVTMSESDDISITANEAPGHLDLSYSLNPGANLISFPFVGSYNLQDVMPLDLIYVTSGIVGEGVAASNFNGQFLGSLTQFEGGKGYWFKVIEPIEFQFVMPTDRQTTPVRSKTK